MLTLTHITNTRRPHPALCVLILVILLCTNPLNSKDFVLTWQQYSQYGDPDVDKLRLEILSPYASIVIDSLSVQDSIATFTLPGGELYTLCFFAVKFDSIYSECGTIHLNLEKPPTPRNISVTAL